MGLPADWDQAAIAAFRSLKKQKRGLEGSEDTGTALSRSKPRRSSGPTAKSSKSEKNLAGGKV